MPVFLLRLLTIVLILTAFPKVYAESRTVELNEKTGFIRIGLMMDYLEDKSGGYTLDDIRAMPDLWQPSTKEIPTFSYTESVYWLKTEIVSYHNTPVTYHVEIAYPVLDYIEAYVFKGDTHTRTIKMGDKYPFAQRPIRHKNFTFHLNLDPGEKTRLYLRFETESSMQLPVNLYQEEIFLDNTQLSMIGYGIYYGTMIVMVFYNLFIFFTVRERHYLYYVLYVAGILVFIASLNGISYQFLWPDSVWWNDEVIVISLLASIFFGILFGKRFLELPESMPRTNLSLNILITTSGIFIPVSFFIPYRYGIMSAIVCGLIAIALAFYAGVVRLKNGFTSAKFYLLAWISILAGGVILALSKYAALPYNFFTEHMIQIGTALEVILLSFALADRLNIMKKEMFEAEKKARIADQRALDIQKKATLTLEKRVAERTEELNSTLCQVETANQHIMSSLRYAGMIQLAILPNPAKVREYFPESFIYWRPRDIVGGDFYYIDKIGQECIIVVADCTGHGVPGAFMTLLSSSELKQIIRGEKCTDPSEILQTLNRRIRRTLKQDTANAFSDEGLDLGVCVIDKSGRTLRYAGARQNLYYIQDQMIRTIKGDRESVGYISSDPDAAFTTHTLNTTPEMQFYMSTISPWSVSG